MSRAFDSLGIVAVFVLFFIIIGKAIAAGAAAVAQFIFDYRLIFAIVAAIIAAAICIFIFMELRKDNSMPKFSPIATCITTFFAIGQNFSFLIYGLYVTLTTYPDEALLLLIAFGGFIVIYVIDTFITVVAVVFSLDKSYGAIFPLLITIAGAILIVNW